ncbi:unnamed protein product [Lymnaea stagnalis]|uniref:Cytochrome P450 n=1 Tax=Lymnaea stagnalis TaxID=6523 RepID=A0AAV2HBD9_LYMST
MMETAGAMESDDPTSITWLFSSVSYYLLLTTILAAIYLIYNQVTDSETWEKYGVKQVTMGLVEERDGYKKLLEEHGDTFGLKRGTMFLVTKDLSILREVMVKDFNNFTDRIGHFNTDTVVSKGVFFLQGQDWRRIRQIITPSFSSGKLKHSVQTVDERAIKLTKILEDYARKSKLVPVKDLTSQYTIEIIAKTAFGLDTDCLGKEDNEFTNYYKTIFKSRGRVMSKVMLFFYRFKALHKFLVKNLKVTLLDGVRSDAVSYFKGILKKSIEERKGLQQKGQEPPSDLLQNFLQANIAEDQIKQEESTPEDWQSNSTLAKGLNWDKLPKTMSEEELIGQSMLIMFAGFDTTATTLMTCLYLLAKHKDAQEKVYKEIESIVRGASPTYEELGQLTYMEQVINETLRLYPPAPIMSRLAAESRTYGSITVPKGAGVMIPIFAVLKDPKNYPDPEKYDPDRFSDENKAKRDPMAFMPFGYGPRNCIGMRLAYLELKIALAHIIRKVTFELNEQTEPKKGEDIVIKGHGILRTEKPIKLAVKIRG